MEALRSRRSGRRVARRRFAPWLLLPGCAALLAEPSLWLIRTFRDPSYQSDGVWVVLAVACLLVASVASGPAWPDPRARRRALRLFALTAAIRLVGRLLDVSTIGALALVVDVAALALWLGVARRPWALQPVALAALAALALPVEHLLQRLAGHPLQSIAASTSEALLRPFFPLLAREGTLLLHPDVALAIDLPCSGARGLVLFGGAALGFACRRLVGPGEAVKLGLAVAGGAWLANVLRIVGLFVGTWAGLPVVSEPWHGSLGAVCIAVGCVPLLRCARGLAPLARVRPLVSRSLASRGPLRWPAALAVSVVGIAVASTPHSPVDVSQAGPGRPLPEELGGFSGAAVPLRDVERRYYARYGGRVQKRVYDDGVGAPHTVLRVRTDSPLRHLHGPDRCLLGAGHRVTREGVAPGAPPTVVYRSVDPAGRAWRVEASFVSDSGESATSVSEVVWRWLEQPDVAWSLVERISPWPRCETQPERCARFDALLFAAIADPGRDRSPSASKPRRPATPFRPRPSGPRSVALVNAVAGAEIH